MKLAVASDHAGFELKEKIREHLTSEGHTVEDFGCYNVESCGTGLGMSYAANRYKGIRAALCLNTRMAEMSRAHNDANVLVLGSRLIDFAAARDILSVWMDTPFEGGRHLRRIRKIDGDE
jgi:ribose 5-phosphate isomerase B